MADLAANTQYKTAGASGASPAKKYPQLNINPGGSIRSYSPIAEQVRQAGSQAAISAPFKTGEPIAPPLPEKISPVPQDYSSFKTLAEYPYEKKANLVAPTTPQIQQLPMGGQWVTEPSQPSSLVKSNREFVTMDEKSRILGALPSSLFQVDHIVPLWVGGADSPQNLQVIPNDQHAVKTKVQAVPLTLLAAGKIDLDTAKRLALTWNSKDATGIPTESENGLLPLDVAEKKYKQWQDYEARGYSAVPFTKKVKDAFANIPEAAKDFGKGWLPDTVREFVKGGVSGATGNILPYTPGEGEGAAAKGAGFVGNIIGTVWGLGKFTKAISPVLAKTGWAAFNPTKAVQLASLADTVAPAVQVAKAVPTTVLGKTLAKIPYREAMTYVRQNAADNIIRNTAIFSTYGLLTEGARQGLFSHEENAIGTMAERLATDVGLGVITGGLANSWKGSLGVGVGTLMLGQMLGEEPENSLVNAFTIAAFHKWGALAPRRLDSAAISKAVEVEVPKVASDVLRWWGGEAPKVTKGQPAETTVAPSQGEVFDWTHKALTNLDNYALAGRNGTELNLQNSITLDQYQQYRSQILSAGRELYKRTLPPAEREAADMADLISLSRSMKDKTFLQNGGLTTPNEVPSFVEKAGADVLVNNSRQPASAGDFSNVSGEMQLTGMGKNEINEAVGRAYIQAKAQGQTSDYVLLVSRPDATPVWRRMSDTFTPENIAANVEKPFQNPQNSVQVVAIMKGPNGEPVIGGEIGWWPRKFTIDEKKFAFNQQPGIQSGKFPKMNPELNKDTVSERMNAEGLPVVLARVTKGSVGDQSNKPYVIVETDNNTWNLSKDIWGGSATPQQGGDVSAAITKFRQSSAASEMMDSISKVKEKAQSYGEDAATVLQRTEVADVTGNKPAVSEYVKQVGTAINQSQTPEQLAQNLKPFGISIDTEMAASMLTKQGDISVRQILGLLKVSVDNGQAGPIPSMYFESVIKPFLKGTRSTNKTLDVWGELPVAPKRPLEQTEPVQMPKGIEETVTPVKAAQEPPVAVKTPAEDIMAAKSTPVAKQGSLFDIPSLISKRISKGDIPVRVGKSTMTTKKGVALKQETNPDGTVWLEQNMMKGSEWAKFAEAGHKIEHLMLPNNRGYAGKVRIDGKEMTYDEARALMKAPTQEIQAPTVAAATVKAQSLLEQAPIKPAVKKVAEDPVYQEAKSGLEQVGLGTGRKFDTLPLDMYVDDVIRYIKNYEVPAGSDATKVKQKLAKDALKLINKEDLDLRAVSMGKSNEAWTGNIRDFDITKYISSMRDRIAAEFDVEAPAREGGIRETRKEKSQRETASVKKDAEGFFASVDENKRATPDSYKRAWGETWDMIARGIFGDSYRSNPNFMRILSDKGDVGEKLWHGTAESEGLLTMRTPDGKQISQPKAWVEAAGRGERGKIPSVYARRQRDLAKAEGARELSRESSGTARSIFGEDAPKYTRSAETSGQRVEQDVLSKGYRIEDRSQSPHENVQDLTRLESKAFLGLLDEELHGHDPRLSPVRGMEDAISFFLDKEWGVLRNYNKLVADGKIEGPTVRLPDLARLKKEVRTAIDREKAEGGKKRTLSDPEKELVDLKKQIERAQKGLEGVTVSSKYRKMLETMKITNDATIADLKKQLTK